MYEPPRNQYNRRRLAEIDRDGTLTSGCRSCRDGALDSYARAGWIEPDPPALRSAGVVATKQDARWVLTNLGREVMAGG